MEPRISKQGRHFVLRNHHLPFAMLCCLLATVAFGAPAFAGSPLPGAGSGWSGIEDLVTAPTAMACTLAPANAQDDYAIAGYPFDVQVQIDLLANDASGVTLGFVGQPSHGSVQVTGPGTVTYTVEEPKAGSDQFVYSVRGCLQCHNGWCSEPDIGFATVHLDLYFIE